MKRVAASVFLIFFGFAVAACGSGEVEQPLNGAFAEADGLSTGESSVDNPGSGEGQGDGRVLKPEGHKGMWFETEPEDPWEHYVWKSQRFVGDPIDLPKLKAKRPNDPLAGLPDVCDEKVIERMREVGFERRKGLQLEGFARCSFSDIEFIKYSAGPTFISLTFDASVGDRAEMVQDQKLNPDDDSLLIAWSESSDTDCMYGVEKDGKLVGFTTFDSFDDGGKGSYQCQKVRLVRQLFYNLTTL